MKIKLPIKIMIATLLLCQAPLVVNAKSIEPPTKDAFSKAIVGSNETAPIYDGNKLRIKSNGSEQEESTIMFKEDFESGNTDNWHSRGMGTSEVVADASSGSKVLKLSGEVELETIKNLLVGKDISALYRFSFDTKYDSQFSNFAGGYRSDFDIGAQFIPMTNSLEWHHNSFVFSVGTETQTPDFHSILTNNAGTTYIDNIVLEKITPTSFTDFSKGKLDGWKVNEDATYSFQETLKGKVLNIKNSKSYPVFPSSLYYVLSRKELFQAATESSMEGVAMLAKVATSARGEAENTLINGFGTTMYGSNFYTNGLDDYDWFRTLPFNGNREYETGEFNYGLLGTSNVNVLSKPELNVKDIAVYKGIVMETN